MLLQKIAQQVSLEIDLEASEVLKLDCTTF